MGGHDAPHPVELRLAREGGLQQVVKFVGLKPIKLAPREEHERLLLVDPLLEPLEARWQAALSTGDVDEAGDAQILPPRGVGKVPGEGEKGMVRW